jgi:hypothetical protein
MIYPIDPHCETQPLIDIRNVTLRNITSTGGYLPAGIIRCNQSNPCTGFKFEDVSVKSFIWDTIGQGYISEYVEGETSGTVFPDPKFKPKGFYSSQENIPDEIFSLESAYSYENMFYMLLRVVK